MAIEPGRATRLRRKRREILAGAPSPATWPAPRQEDIPPADQAAYYANKRAVEMWADESTDKEIFEATNLHAVDARRIAERCAVLNRRTGSVHGYWACLPNRRLESTKHTRRKAFNAELAKDGKGRTGALNDLFRRYPSVARGMLEFAMKRRVGQGAPAAIVTRAIVHETFIALCKIEKIDERNEWPFDATRRGYKAIWEWFQGCMAKAPVAAARNMLGDEAAKLAAADYAGIGSESLDGRRLAFERVELDEHYLDGMFTVAMPIGKGRFVSVKATRIWALVLREVESKAVLASGVSFGQRYSTADVLSLVYRALCPPKRKALTFSNPHYQYRSDAAFPGELSEFCGNGWQTLALDADSTHLSVESLVAARDVVKCHVVSERIGTASARGCIEGFFPFLSKLMESSPAATGSKPDSAARRDPEGAAIRWNIVGTLADELLDLYCRNFNATQSAAAGGVSPLRRLGELREANEYFKFPINDLSSAALWKLLPMEPATVTRRRGENGFGPLGVNLFGGRYVGPELSRDQELAFASNKDVSVYVQEDARFAFVVPGAFPDRVYQVALKGRYADMPHTLAWRRLASNAAKNAAIAGQADSPQIMFGLLQGLGEAAKTDGEATSVLAGAVSFMNRYGFGDVGYVEMTETQRAALLAFAKAQGDDQPGDSSDEDAEPINPPSGTPARSSATPPNDPYGLL